MKKGKKKRRRSMKRYRCLYSPPQADQEREKGERKKEEIVFLSGRT